jgi:hypothetical protein
VLFQGTFFWNVLQAPILGILFHPGFQNLLILVNSSGDWDISGPGWNLGPAGSSGDFQVVVPGRL